MEPEYEILSIKKFEDENYHRKNDNLIVIEMTQRFHYSYNEKTNIDVMYYHNKSFPVWFSVDDNIHLNSEDGLTIDTQGKNIKTAIFVNDNNIIHECLTPEFAFDRKYRLLLDLKKHESLFNKLLSVNYKKTLYTVEAGRCIIINLIYTPDERAVKINKIKQNIKSKFDSYDI